MITAPEVARSLYGAWRLVRFDRHGLDQFGDTEEAFWRSFYAMLIAAPGHVVLSALGLATLRETGLELTSGPIEIFLIEAIGYVIAWFAFPFVMLYVANHLDRGERYFRYIAATNWATVLQIGLYLLVAAVVRGIELPEEIGGYIRFAAMIAMLVYFWFITRVGLEISGRVAAAIVGLHLVLGFAINFATLLTLR